MSHWAAEKSIYQTWKIKCWVNIHPLIDDDGFTTTIHSVFHFVWKHEFDMYEILNKYLNFNKNLIILEENIPLLIYIKKEHKWLVAAPDFIVLRNIPISWECNTKTFNHKHIFFIHVVGILIYTCSYCIVSMKDTSLFYIKIEEFHNLSYDLGKSIIFIFIWYE